MTEAEARDDRPWLSGWHPGLAIIILLTFAPRAVDDVLGDLATRVTAHNPWHFWFPLATGAAEIIALLAAGLLVDRYGVRVVTSLSLCAWAVVTAIAATVVRDSPALYLMHAGALVVGMPFGIAGNVVVKYVVPFARRARFVAVLDVAATASILGARPVAGAAGWPPALPSAPAWVAGGLVVAGGGSILAALWWASRLPGREAASVSGIGTTSSLSEALVLLRRPGMLALVLVMACHLTVFATLYRVLPFYVLRLRFLPSETFTHALIAPLALYAATKLVMAAWSDGRARRTGSPARARVPFIVAGAVLAATIGLIPLVSNAALGTILWPLAVGMAIFPAVFPLGLDVVPAAFAGRFLGLALAVGVAVTLAAFVLATIVSTIRHDMAPFFYIAAIAAVAAAILSLASLRKIEPVEDDAGLARAIGKVFA